MKNSIVSYNASIIYDCPNSIFIADQEGKLSTISRFNLVGRIIEWVKDIKSGGERSKNSEKAITETLEKIVDNIKTKKYFYIQDNDRLRSSFSLTSILYKRLPVHLLKYNHPVDVFADKILHSPLRKKPMIAQAAEEMKEHALPIIKSLRDDEKEEIFKKPYNI